MKTIRAQLLIGLSCCTVACALVAGAGLYKQVRKEANELSDLQMREIAYALPNVFGSNTVLPATEDPEAELVIQVWDQQDTLLYSSRPQAAIPRYRLSGFQSVKLNGERWRIYGETRHERFVQISQPMEVRQELAQDMTRRISIPLLVFLVVLSGLIWVIVGRALRPLNRVATAVAGRSPNALQPLELGGLPPELKPIVESLNQLLLKIDQAMTAQRNFVADAAHELRSPLTALKLQLQLAERAGTDELRVAAFAKLHERLDRSNHLVQQLLTLARNEPGQVPARLSTVDLHQLAQWVVANQSTYAESREIDLGVEADSVAVLIEGDADGLRVLLNNLVDNALRYTQVGGQVDVMSCVEEGHPLLRVQDNGPGVPEPERARLFDRFYRPDGNTVWGCGLGMSIVKNIADFHHADIRLSENVGGIGFMVTLVFQPASTPDSTT